MNDLNELFRRQAEWQREQANLPWAEKLRLSVIMREALLALRRSGYHDGSFHDSDEQSEH